MAHQLEAYDELAKQFKFQVSDYNKPIFGYIWKTFREGGTYNYYWELSHYCRLEYEAEPYRPGGKCFADTEVQATEFLMEYMKRFETAVDVHEN